jgi:hypothetical protein
MFSPTVPALRSTCGRTGCTSPRSSARKKLTARIFPRRLNSRRGCPYMQLSYITGLSVLVPGAMLRCCLA